MSTPVDGDVGLAPDLSGQKVDNSAITRADGTQHLRQRVNVSDPSDPNAHGAVLNQQPPPGTYGQVVWFAQEIDIATGARQDAQLAQLQALAQSLLYCDTNNVQVAGGTIAISALPPVTAQVSGTVNTVPQTLPPNASQESGGNLDKQSAALADVQQSTPQLRDVLLAILVQLNVMAEQQGARIVSYPL